MQQYHSRKSLTMEITWYYIEEHFHLDKHISKLLKDVTIFTKRFTTDISQGPEYGSAG